MVLALFALPSISWAIDDESLMARYEYSRRQAEKRREAEEARRLEELKHIKVLDVNSVLKTIADEEDSIAEVVIVYKSGVKDRYIAPAPVVEAPATKEEAVGSVTGGTAPAKVVPSAKEPTWIEGRRFAGRNVW